MTKDFYSINELSTISGFTTRSLRNFIQMEFLKGEKFNGEWRFSLEQIEDFFSNPNIKEGIKSKNNSVVYNYLLNKPENDKICSIVDLNLTPNETKTLSEKICQMINDSNANVEFKFSAHNGNVRIIIAGEKNFVKQILLLI
jgi:hypothetical protein